MGSRQADQGIDQVQQGDTRHVTLVEAYLVHSVDPTTGSTVDGTVASSDTQDVHDAETDDGNYADADAAGMQTESEQGQDTVAAGSTEQSSVQENLTVHTVDPTTGSTADGTVVGSDTQDSHDDEADVGDFAEGDSAGMPTESDQGL